jgi:hypothetical protein
MSVLRWVIVDPYDANPTTNTYTFPRNPAEMSSVYPERAVSSLATTNGKVLLYEGTTPPKQFTFGGPVLDKQQFLDLQTWVYSKKRRLNLTDHYGRVISCVLTAVDLVPKRRINYYYSHQYEVTGLVLSVGAPTVANTGPV